MLRRITLALLSTAVLLAATGVALAETRLALIIANQGYDARIGTLRNPANDAAMVGAALGRLGFEVEIVPDASRTQILGAVDRYAQRLGSAGADAVGFFYYSGHGASKPGTDRNYLIPLDAGDPHEAEFWHQAVPLEDVRRSLNEYAPRAAHIVVFDACRNELQLPVRGAKGFTPVAEWGGMLIAYSTAPNMTASDGEAGAPAGPYAQALAEELDNARGVTATEVFRNVRFKVRERVPAQAPWYLYGLDREVSFGEAGDGGDAVITSGGGSAPTSGFRVIETLLHVEPRDYSGSCPVKLTFTGRISVVGGSGTVSYRFLRSDNARAPIETLEFDGPGSKPVTTTWTLGAATPRFQPFEGWQQIEIYDPHSTVSGKAQFRINCR